MLASELKPSFTWSRTPYKPREQYEKEMHVPPLEFRATKDLEQPLGTLRWSLQECATGEILSSGDREFLLGDAVVFVKGDSPMPIHDTAIPLGAGFYLCRPAFSRTHHKEFTGFGLMLYQPVNSAFSWEWFDVDGVDHATKRQEGGELRMSIARYGDWLAVDRTEFLTDISLRAMAIPFPPNVSDLVKIPEIVSKPGWRALISKGSSIRWPSLIGGQLVLE